MVKKKQTTRKNASKTNKSKQRSKVSKNRNSVEPDSAFFLKIVIFLILGSQWIYIESLPDWSLPIPVGLIIGLVFATHEHFQIDRKIEFVVLLISAFIAFWLPIGLVISV